MPVHKLCCPVLLCLIVFILGPVVRSQTSSDVMATFETVDLQNGVIAFISPETHSQLVNGNSVAIIGDDGVVVVDSGQFPSLTRKMIAEIRKRTGKPVRYVVNTHWHNDHVMGNSVFREEFPGVSIISTPETKANGDRYNPPFLEMERNNVPAAEGQVNQILATRKSPAGKQLDDAAIENYQALSADLREFKAMLPELRYEGPNVTFKDELDLYLGKRLVRVLFLGKGNTAGDAVVYVPDAKVLATGDLLVLPIPFATSSFVEEWIQTLDKLRTFGITAMIPGHGQVQHDYASVDVLSTTLKSLLMQVKQAVAQGKSLEQTQALVHLESEKSAAVGSSTLRSRNWDQYFQRPAVATTYKQLKGIPTDENPLSESNR
ncbi:MAG TPA: MBL fold metallo-hydrolase [Bryobacteraceae bacterium]|nr:MBL fold metallo-hydrolase [Bryobacteraceae bacterium]